MTLFFGFTFLFFAAHSSYSGEVGVSNDRILLGQSAAFSGASAWLGTEFRAGAQALFEKVNSEGGVNGRRIELKSIDDAYDPDRALANTIELEAKDKVFALFGYVGTPTLVRVLPLLHRYFDREGLFLFSNFTGAQPQRSPPNDEFVFNVRASYRQETEGLIEKFHNIGYRRFGLFIQNDAYGRSGADGVQRALKARGLKVISEATYNRGALFESSMLEQVKLLKDSGVEVVISVGSYNACAAFVRDARLNGFAGPIANVSFVGASAMLSLLTNYERKNNVQLTKLLVNSQVVPPLTDESLAIVKEYRIDFKTHQKDGDRIRIAQDLGITHDPTFISFEGYISAKTFVEIIKRIPKEKLTRKEFVKELQKSGTIDIGLSKANPRFSSGRHQALDDVWYTTVVDGNWQELKNWKALK